MKRVLRVAGVLLALVMLCPFLISAGRAEAAPAAVHVLFTHDMHAHFLPNRVSTEGGVAVLGGYARLKTLIDSYRSQHPDALLLDAGDFSMGTLFQTLYATDAADIRMLGLLGYDAVTLGNHEFDFRGAGLARMLDAAAQSAGALPKIVQANHEMPPGEDGSLSATLADMKRAMDDYGVAPYTVIERGGLRIGVFGLMGREAASNAPMSDVVFTDPVPAARAAVQALREQENVDIVICLSHSGTWEDPEKSEDELLAAAVPGIDLIISGHTHTRLDQAKVVGSTVIASCGENGEALGTLTLTRQADGWALTDYALVPVTDAIPGDPAIAAAVDDFRQLVQTRYLDAFGMAFDQVLTHTDFDFIPAHLIGREHKEEGLPNLITDAYLWAVARAEGEGGHPVTAAIVPSGTLRGSFLAGDITVADAYHVSSLGVGPDGLSGYPLVSAYLTGRELKTLCEVDASVAPLMPEAQLYISGLRYAFNPHRLIFNKVRWVTLEDGSPLEPDRLYRVVCGLYSAQMLGVVGEKSYHLLSIVPKDASGAPITDFDQHIIYTQVNGRPVELKEWLALAQYLQSFGTRGVDSAYKGTLGRKVVDDSRSPAALLGSLNAIGGTVLAVALLLIALLVWLIVALATAKKRRARRAARRAA